MVTNTINDIALGSRQFTIHKADLCVVSRFCGDQLGTKKSWNVKMTFDDIDAQEFTTFFKWVQTRRFPCGTWTLKELAELWLLGHRFECTRFRNEVMARMEVKSLTVHSVWYNEEKKRNEHKTEEFIKFLKFLSIRKDIVAGQLVNLAAQILFVASKEDYDKMISVARQDIKEAVTRLLKDAQGKKGVEWKSKGMYI